MEAVVRSYEEWFSYARTLARRHGTSPSLLEHHGAPTRASFPCRVVSAVELAEASGVLVVRHQVQSAALPTQSHRVLPNRVLTVVQAMVLTIVHGCLGCEREDTAMTNERDDMRSEARGVGCGGGAGPGSNGAQGALVGYSDAFLEALPEGLRVAMAQRVGRVVATHGEVSYVVWEEDPGTLAEPAQVLVKNLQELETEGPPSGVRGRGPDSGEDDLGVGEDWVS